MTVTTSDALGFKQQGALQFMSLLKKNRQQGKGVYMGVWALPTLPYIPFPFSLLSSFQCIHSSIKS
jgi:hypothetical protein